MRVLSILLLAILSITATAKNPPSAASSPFQTYRLFNNNLFIDVPTSMKVEREFFHYWDKCPDGGYSIAFESDCSNRGGMNLQINVHSITPSAEHLDDWYDPRKHCIEKLIVLQDTTYISAGKQYTVYSTLAAPTQGSKRSGKLNNNYHLRYYIQADGRMLEFHYFYWDKDGRYLDYWRDMAQRMAGSIRWQSNGWAMAKN